MDNIAKFKVFLKTMLISIIFISCQNSVTSSDNTKAVAEHQKVYLNIGVEGMTCSGCEMTVQQALIAIDGIDSAFASHIDKKVLIYVDSSSISLKIIQETIDSKGYSAGTILK